MSQARFATRSAAACTAIRVLWVVGPGAVLAAVAQEGLGTSCAPDSGGCDLESLGFVVACLAFVAVTLALVAAAVAADAWRRRGRGFAAWHLAGLAAGALGALAVFVLAPGPEPRHAVDLLPYVAAFALPYALGVAAAWRAGR